MQMSRLFEMVYLLTERKRITAGELAERFEVSVRTIYRDVDILCQAGIPVYTSKGRGGGISILEEFVLDKSVLSGQERNEILWALQGAGAVGAMDSSRALTKLKSLFGGHESKEQWLEVDFSDWGEESRNLFYQLKTAILDKRAVEFEYYNSCGIKSSRQAEPLQFWFKTKAWYLKAYCRKSQELRLFKLSRIRGLRLLEDGFTRGLPPCGKEEHSQKMQGSMIRLTLIIHSSQAFRVFDEFRDEDVKRLENGDFMAALTCPENDWVYSYILSYGEMAKVQNPERIRSAIEEKIKKMGERYKI